ncbi:MAG: MFS transporter [Pseudomonadota bacterium]
MTAVERRAVFSLAGVSSLRMFGLFLLLPVMAIYAENYEGSTSLTIGVAIGIYGLTQACLQIPFGILSDRWGRKPMIICGLLIFAAGSVIAAVSTSIAGLVIGRAVQGAGAVSSVVIALVADVTRVEQRTKAMAIVGVTIGASFLLSMVVSPPLAGLIGLSGLFWLIAIFAVMAMGVVTWWVPAPVRGSPGQSRRVELSQLLGMLRMPELLRLDFGILTLHLVLTALFLVLPGLLTSSSGLEATRHWQIYVPTLVGSAVGMIPLVRMASGSAGQHRAFKLGIAVCVLALLGLVITADAGLVTLSICLFLFFTGFNALESMLPALLSQAAPADGKGSASGIYSTAQFAGIFLGGGIGGVLLTYTSPAWVFLFCCAVMTVWLFVELQSAAFKAFDSKIVELRGSDSQKRELVDRIRSVPGVAETVWIPEESVVYLKVDKENFDNAKLEVLCQQTPASDATIT